MPTTNGTKVSRVIFSRSGANELTWPLACINSRTSSGVNMTPKMFESAALNIAPDVLPLATSVRTTDVETVEGNTHRYRKPSRNALGSEGQMMRVISWNARCLARSLTPAAKSGLVCQVVVLPVSSLVWFSRRGNRRISQVPREPFRTFCPTLRPRPDHCARYSTLWYCSRGHKYESSNDLNMFCCKSGRFRNPF